jgi:hypothetical protein
MLAQVEAAGSVSVRAGVHYPETVHNFLSSRLAHLLRVVMETEPDSFQSRLGPQGTLYNTLMLSNGTECGKSNASYRCKLYQSLFRIRDLVLFYRLDPDPG